MNHCEAGLRIARLGYPVFPVDERKRPLTNNGCHDASTDPSVVERYWKQSPNANIGLHCAGLVVIDVDWHDKGKPTARPNTWLADEPDKLALLQAAPSQITPTGGVHYVFSKPAELSIKNWAGKLAPNVDIRTDGGYIVVAPSKIEGKLYRWINELCPQDALQQPPDFLLQALAALSHASTPGAPAYSTPINRWKIDHCDEIERRAIAYLGMMPEAVSGQGGHNALYTAAVSLVHGFGIAPDRALGILEAHYNPRCAPPWSERELRHKVDDAVRKPHSKPYGWLRDAEQVSDRDALARLLAESWNSAPGVVPGASDAEPLGPVLINMADVVACPVDWLWQDRIALGRLSVLVGMPGAGKSFLTCDMAARISTGTGWPDGAPCPRGSVILLTAEDDPSDTIRPRLDAHGADVSRIHLLTAVRSLNHAGRPEERVFTLADLAALEAALQQVPDCKLIVIDPIGSYLGGRTDAHRDNEVRAVLAPLASLASKYGAAVLIVMHRRKGQAELADDTAMGSRAFTGIARAVWHLTKDPEHARRRLLLPGKNNLAAEPDGLAFCLPDTLGAIEWEADSVAMNADDALRSEQAGPGNESAGGQAAAWLSNYLAAGPRPAIELKEAAREAGIAEATLRRAKQRLCILSTRETFGGPWFWELPCAATIGGQALKDKIASAYGPDERLCDEPSFAIPA